MDDGFSVAINKSLSNSRFFRFSSVFWVSDSFVFLQWSMIHFELNVVKDVCIAYACEISAMFVCVDFWVLYRFIDLFLFLFQYYTVWITVALYELLKSDSASPDFALLFQFRIGLYPNNESSSPWPWNIRLFSPFISFIVSPHRVLVHILLDLFLLGANVNVVILKFHLLVYRKMTDICILTLYSARCY